MSLDEPPGNCIKDSEFESGENICIVKGSLKNRLQFWHKINANVSIIDVLKNGYKIPVITLPKAAKFPNNHSTLNHANFVTQAVKQLLNKGRIKEVKILPYVVNPLSVSGNGSQKLRLILDLRYVNKHVFKDKIKFDDWKIMQDFLQPTDLLFKFDISQGYHSIDIHEQHQKYLGFSWKIKGQTRYFVFPVLLFGLASAPFVFTKVMRCLVTFLRSQGIKISVFIDDGLGSADKVQPNIHSLVVKKSLTEAVFLINTQKSIWQQQRELTWLDVKMNLDKLCFSIQQTRMKSIFFSPEKILKNLSYTTARKFAKVCGKLISTKFVMGNIVQLKTRNLYKIIGARHRWDNRISVRENDDVINEIHFRRLNVNSFNCRPIIYQEMPHVYISSDASNYALAAYYIFEQTQNISFKIFFPDEAAQSSTWRELFAIYFALKSFDKNINSKHICWQTDNCPASINVSSDSNKQHLQKLAQSIYDLTVSGSIKLDVQWVPRKQNTITDVLSKMYVFEDWETTNTLFKYLNRVWGSFTIDRFANNKSCKTKVFNSKHRCPNTACVDAFSASWQQKNNYLVPSYTFYSKAHKTAHAIQGPSSVSRSILAFSCILAATL